MNDRRSEVSTTEPSHDGCQGAASRKTTVSWASVETALGSLRVFWNTRGLVRLCLPGDAARAETFSQASEAVLPAWGAGLSSQLQALAKGERADFGQVPLDLRTQTDFQREVLQACAQIPWGEVVTYGELAKRTGRKVTASRAVGKALSLNPVPLVVPCHRVLGASGKLTGFTAPGGVDTKRQLLTLEGALEG